MSKHSSTADRTRNQAAKWSPLASLFKTAAIISLLISTNAPLIAAQAADEADNAPVEMKTVAPKPDWEDLGDPNSKENAEKPEPKKSKYLIEGSVDYLVPSGTPFKLKLAAVPTHGAALKLADRDLDGKLFPAKVGDIITARTSEDMFVDDNKVIPEGTIFHGVVSEVEPPRRVNRKGWLKISFNSLTTPNGRDFVFQCKADNFQKSTVKSKLKGAAGIASFSAGGAIVGALVAYQIFGLHETIAMHGYNIAGGAAGGALLATCYAVMRHGAKATLEPGDDLNMAIDTDLLMPAATDASTRKAQSNRKGVDIKILKIKTYERRSGREDTQSDGRNR